MNRLHRWLIIGGVLGTTVGCDRATKHLAVSTLKHEPTRSFLGDIFRLGYAENTGAFLGMGGELPGSVRFWIFTVAVGLVLLGMLAWIVVGKRVEPWTVAGMAMIVGGGASNWVDRVLNDGHVVDFLNLGIGSLRTGIFNVADVAIMAGAVIIAFLGAKKPRPPEEAPAP